MTVAALLSSQPIDVHAVKEAIRASGVEIEALPIEDVPFDAEDRKGLAKLMDLLGTWEILCLVDGNAGVYGMGLFDDDVSGGRVRPLISAVRAG
jgi:hypothetical protein